MPSREPRSTKHIALIGSFLLGLGLVGAVLVLTDDAPDEIAEALTRGREVEPAPATIPPDLPIEPPSASGRGAAIEPVAVVEATSIEVPDEPNEFDEVWEEAPEDPIERGACALHLSVIDRATREPVVTGVHLFRLDAPENEAFGRGDQLQQVAYIPIEGLFLTDLPEDEYRVVVDAQRLASPSPPAFEVAGSLTRHVLEIDLPRSVPIWLEVYEVDGTRLEEIDLRSPEDRVHWDSNRREDWMRKRPVLAEGFVEFESSEGSPLGGDPIWESRRAESEGFALGQAREPNKGEHRRTLHGATLPGRTRVELWVDPETLDFDSIRELRYVAVLADLDDLLPHVLLPDGSDATAFAEAVDACCRARPRSSLSTDEPWRELPVQVHARPSRHAELRFDWWPLQGPPMDRVLTRLP